MARWNHRFVSIDVAPRPFGFKSTAPRTCSGAGCKSHAVIVGMFEYGTSRTASQRATCDLPLCRVHAEEFAERHRLKLPKEVSGIDITV